jgi:hypothetical protein
VIVFASEFGEPVIDEFGCFDERMQGVITGEVEGDGGAVETGVAKPAESAAGRAAEDFDGEILAFAETDEEKSRGAEAGLAGGVQQEELFFRAFEFFGAELAEQGTQARGRGGTFILERKGQYGRRNLRIGRSSR